MPGEKRSEKQKRNMTLSDCASILFAVAGILLLVILISLCLKDNVNVQKSRTDRGFTVVSDYTCREIERADTPIGIVKEYRFTVSETMEHDTSLAFYTVHQYVDVYLDGQNIYSLKHSENNPIGKTVGSNWVMIPLYREDAGKEIRIEITPVYESFRNREVEFLIGSQLSIYVNRLLRDLPQLIFSVMTIFVGVVFVCLASYSLYKRRRGKSMIALGLLSIIIGLWRLTDTRFTPFMFPNRPILVFYISIAMMMFGVVPLIKSVEEGFNKTSRKILDVCCIGNSLVCLVQLLLQIMGVADLRESLFVTHITIAVCTIVLIGNVIYEWIKWPEKRKMLAGKGLPLILVAGVLADIVAFYVKGNSSGLLFSLLGFLVYIMIMGISRMLNYSEQEIKLLEKDRQLAENELQLTESRITAMMSQIRTHFIFNILTAISGMCEYNPKKADDTLMRFSRYLRSNIDIMLENRPEAFTKSLQHLEDYIALQQVRFGEKIRFEKELEATEFTIPPMILQPIVENSIKHGLLPKTSGGTIRLQSKSDGENVMVIVIDDGVGFNPDDLQYKEGVGLSNVRFRLQHMVNGTMCIESCPGKGTKVTLSIPISLNESRKEKDT
ncbi:MAG: histidine kinase [Lachnospiraceae bacterium]|nr:histidine kinase [Lachnospiraceae bacterium]